MNVFSEIKYNVTMLFSLLNTDVSKYYTEENKLHNFDQNGANHSWNLSINIDTWKTLKCKS